MASSKNITIYTSNNCQYCVMVKKYLDMKGANYSEVNIDSNPDKKMEVEALSGQRRVPVTIVEHEDGRKDMSIGYNLPSLSAAIA